MEEFHWQLAKLSKILKITDNKQIVNPINIKLDKIDFEIKDLLSINERMPFRQIAKKAGKSNDTIAKRYNKMVKNKIIKVVIQINLIELCYRGWMIFNLSFSAKIPISKKIKKINDS